MTSLSLHFILPLRDFMTRRKLFCIFSFAVYEPDVPFSSVHFSHTVMSDSLQPCRLQHARPPCPSSTPGVHSNSCPLNQWWHPTISSFVAPFSTCPQSFPASGSFPMSQLFTSGSQSIGASASVLPMSIQGWFPLGLIDWFDLLAVQGVLQSLL